MTVGLRPGRLLALEPVTPNDEPLAKNVRLATAFGCYYGGELPDKSIIDAETNKNKGVCLLYTSDAADE